MAELKFALWALSIVGMCPTEIPRFPVRVSRFGTGMMKFEFQFSNPAAETHCQLKFQLPVLTCDALSVYREPISTDICRYIRQRHSCSSRHCQRSQEFVLEEN